MGLKVKIIAFEEKGFRQLCDILSDPSRSKPYYWSQHSGAVLLYVLTHARKIFAVSFDFMKPKLG